MDNEMKVCCICGRKFTGWGNNPYPVTDDGECCDACNSVYVIPARLRQIYAKNEKEED